MIIKVKHLQRFPATYFLFALFLLFSTITYSVLAQAQSGQPTTKPQDGGSRGRPTRREGTGSRNGECPAVNRRLTALVTSDNVSLAVEEHPTFWFFIPYESSQASFVKFSLQDENNKDIYRTSFKVTKAGIVSISIPSNIPPLEVNKNFQWYLKIYCNDAKNQVGKEPSDYVFGLMRRVALKPELANQIKTLDTPQKRIKFYQENGIWQSALTEAAKLGESEPQNTAFMNEWKNLLKGIGLEDLIQQPIVGKVS